MIFFFILLVSMFLALAGQHYIPPLPTIGARVLLMQIIMFYGAVALPGWGMLGLAFSGGLMWDLLHTQIIDGQVEIGLGWSIVLYTIFCTIMSGFRPLFQRGRWEIHCILCGVFVSATVLAEYVMISVRRQPLVFNFDREIWWRIGGAGITAMLIAPFLFFFLNYVGYLVGYDPDPEHSKERTYI